jgi:UPF0755 protein
MSNRRPADPHFSGRATGPLARSPAERLEPTRPAGRLRRQRFSREPDPSRPFVRLVSGIFTLLLLAMLVVGAAAVVFHNRMHAPGPLAAGKVVVIPKGEGSQEIATRLERDGIIRDRRLFMAGYLLSKFTAWVGGSGPVQLKAGDYEIPQAASARQVLAIIADGKTISYRVTIPEGLTSHQIVERLGADINLSGTIEDLPTEGSLLPETFIVQRGAPRQSIIDSMRAEARKLHARAWPLRKKGLPFKTWQEAMVLASIVEKETGRNDERERVAAVFINRLKRNMRLQSDPTILYGIDGGKAVWSRPILKSEITKKTAHNTYQIDGLPPTPICNPGRAAIEAVLNPADTKDLYFVADGTGGHVFAETLKEHNANVSKWRAREKEMKVKAAAPPDSDTPTTAAEKPPATARPAPSSAKDKKRATTAAPPQAKAPPGGKKGDRSWAPVTHPAQSKR